MNRIVWMLLIFTGGLTHRAMAQGNLLVTPTRVVFEGNKQMEELNLLNMGKDTATYSITFVQKRMNEDGSFETIEKADSGQMFADPYLRIFPRQVTLAPGEPQVIMLQCRRRADMAAGEYRSHLFFRSEKDYMPLGMKKTGRDSTLLSVQLIPVFGISIPVIIRSGEVTSTVSLSDLQLHTGPGRVPSLQLILHRRGNGSTYGNLSVEYVPEKGKPYEIGETAGVGVYSNISKRQVTVTLSKASELMLKKGRLRVKYTGLVDNKSILYAEKELEMNARSQ